MKKHQHGRIEALTGLRFLAAASILIWHTTAWTAPFTTTNPVTSLAGMIGIYGMPLFFVLSGFVIHYNYATMFHDSSWSLATVKFFTARFSRLYPLYLFLFAIGMISDFTANWLRNYLADFVTLVATSLTLTQSWVYVIVVNHRLLLENAFGLGWSVSTEWFFYCAYVVLVFAIFRLQTPRTTILGIVGFSVAVLAILVWAEAHSQRIVDWARQYITDDPALTSADYGFHRWLFYYSPYVRILEFVIGCLTAHLYMQLSDRPVTARERFLGRIVLSASLAALALIGLFRLTDSLPPELSHFMNFLVLNFGCAVPIASLLFCISRYDSAVGRMLAARPLVQMGEISYSIYGVHTWTLRAFVRPAVPFDFTTGIEAVVRIPLAMVFSVIMATATYRLIEVPCRRYLRDRLSQLINVRRQDRQSVAWDASVSAGRVNLRGS
jgi:peptidoglycan/LPS O-acetylase OafA/YrhL